jgi:hypothetical protein
MKYLSFYIVILGLIVINLLTVSCNKNQEPVYQMKTFEFNRNIDSIKSYMLSKSHIKFDLINDSTIGILGITDSIKPWDQTHFVSCRDTIGMNRFYALKQDSALHKIDSCYSTLNRQFFNGLSINKNTRIILLNPADKNDTLKYEGQKKFGNLNVYSFYYRFHGYDGDYRLYLCDSIGEIAFYSGAWNNIVLLDNIINSASLNSKWQNIKSKLLADTSFFPIPFEVLPKNEVIYFSPYNPK